MPDPATPTPDAPAPSAVPDDETDAATTTPATASIAPDPIPVADPASAPSFDPHSSGELNFLRTVLGPKAWAAHRARTGKRLEAVMALARATGTIDRTAVRLHLNVSQAAATRYLTALVHQGRLTRRHEHHDNVYEVVG